MESEWLLSGQPILWPEIKGLIHSLTHPTSQAHFQKLGFNFPPLRPVVKNFWRSEMAETARSGAVPLPVVTPGKQKGFAADIQGFALNFSLDFLLLHLREALISKKCSFF